MKEYPVFLNKKCVGNAAVRQEGLYCRILCRCDIFADGFVRLYVSDGETTRNLGILVPDGESFVVDTRIRAMDMKKDNLSFWVSQREREEIFIPIDPHEEFTCLDKLRQARFEIRNGVCGIVVPADPE